MPWKPSDATSKTKAANTPAKKRKWSKTANAALKNTGNDKSAIRIANASVKKGKR